MKKVVSLLLAAVMVFACLPFAFADGEFDGKLIVLHSNDVHGAVEGYAFMAGLKDEFEKMGADVVLADAGDFFNGNVYAFVSKGGDPVSLMNEVGYDVACPGNHEFDFGFENMAEKINGAKFAFVCANMFGSDGETVFDGSVIIEKGGVKLGFFGLETPEVKTKANPAYSKGISVAASDELYEIADSEALKLRNEGADKVICLSHLGVESSSAPNTSYDLWENTDGIDFIIDGHSHTVMEQGKNAEPIQSTGTAFKNIGVICIDEETKEIEDNYLYEITEDSPKNEDVAEKANVIINKVDAEYGEVFAESRVELNGEKAPGNRTEETNSGDLITDAMLWYLTEKCPVNGETVSAENTVAVMNGGTVRAAIKAGNISKKDINNVLPFGNTLCVVYVSGSNLLEALEASTFSTPAALGGFPQVSGITYTLSTYKEYDPAQEPYPGSTYYPPETVNRVEINSVNGRAFDKNAIYAVAVSDFAAAGGDTYYAFSKAEQFDTGITVDSIVMQYISEKLGGVIGEEYANPAGRIIIRTEPDAEKTFFEKIIDAIKSFFRKTADFFEKIFGMICRYAEF